MTELKQKLYKVTEQWRRTARSTSVAAREIPNLLARGHMHGMSDGLNLAANDVEDTMSEQKTVSETQELAELIEELKQIGITMDWGRVYDAGKKIYSGVFFKHQVEWLRNYAYIHRVVSFGTLGMRKYGCEILFSMKDPAAYLPQEERGHQICGDLRPIMGTRISSVSQT
jgi:hypothetical protein